MPQRACLTSLVAIALVGCNATQSADDVAEPGRDSAEEVAGPDGCERDAGGQVQCLAEAFGVSTCDDARVMGSVFRDNSDKETYEYRTAFASQGSCLVDVQAAATSRRFKQGETPDRLVLKTPEGLSETLIIGAHGLFEWERIQK